MKGFPDLPPIWLAGFLILNWAVSTLIPGFPVGIVTTTLSWTLIFIGLGLIAWSAFWFWRRKTTIEPHHAPNALIKQGPFKISRNPIYLALLIILIGAVFGRGQPISLFLLPIFVVILSRRFVIPEENALLKAFGQEAETYINSTRRWI